MKPHLLSIGAVAAAFMLVVPSARSATPPAKTATDQVGPTWRSGLYVYDGADNISAIGTVGSPAGDGLYTTYTYDPMSRLLGASAQRVSPASPGSPHSETYRYDQYGNMTRSTAKDGSEVDFTIDTGNHLTGTSIQYDEAGNLISYGGESYVYDAANMMVAKDHDTTWHDRYLYTADDQRIGARVGDKWTWTFRDANQQVIRQFEGSYSSPTAGWKWVQDYEYGPRGAVAAQRPAPEGGLRHFHLDQIGTARLITNAYGASISQHDYQPFGIELTSSRQEAPNREEWKKLTGHERDLVPDGLPNQERYLDYMHARYYNPSVGRFLSVDPAMDLKKTMANPQMWNRYAYVLNNPVGFTDPDGREHVNEPGFTRPLSEANDWADFPQVSWAFQAQATLLSLAADEFVIGPAVGSVVGLAVNSVRIRVALDSASAATRLEGEMARALGPSLTQFRKVFTVAKDAGEIDAATSKAVFEVTTGAGKGKLGQLNKLTRAVAGNREVILVGKNIGKQAGAAIRAAGYKIFKTVEEAAAYARTLK